MAIGAFLPLGLFVVIAGSVGLRLTRLWRRTGGVPEGSLGVGLLLVTASMPLTAVGRVPALALQPIGRICFATGLACAGLGLCGMVWFNRTVFRPEARWAGVLVGFAVILLVGSVTFMSAMNFTGDDVHAIKRAMRPGTVALLATVLGCFGWAAIESVRSHASARRRRVLGLCDALVVNRFLLWALANLACSALLTVVVGCVLADMLILREPLPLSIIAASGVVMSICWALTFFAPERYRAWVRGGAAGQSPSPTSSRQPE